MAGRPSYSVRLPWWASIFAAVAWATVALLFFMAVFVVCAALFAVAAVIDFVAVVTRRPRPHAIEEAYERSGQIFHTLWQGLNRER